MIHLKGELRAQKKLLQPYSNTGRESKPPVKCRVTARPTKPIPLRQDQNREFFIKVYVMWIGGNLVQTKFPSELQHCREKILF
jgi:hypothetical protein